jgi:glycosyltransferase involved in cell wall biosynthesis
MTIFVDISSLWANYGDAPSGIQRVEAAFARAFLDDTDVKYLAWAEQQREPREVPPSMVRRLASGPQVSNLDELVQCPVERKFDVRTDVVDRIVQMLMALGSAVGLREPVRKSIPHYFFYLSPAARKIVLKSLKILGNRNREQRLSLALEQKLRSLNLHRKAEAEFHKGDEIIICNIALRKSMMEYLIRQRRKNDVRLAVFLHDIIPIRAPHLVSDELAEMFEAFIGFVGHHADKAICNSKFTCDDVRAYFQEQKFPSKDWIICPPGPGIRADGVARPSDRLRRLELQNGQFVIYVSTIEPRKNHQFACQLWRALAERLKEQTFPLIFAGSLGWSSGMVERTVTSDPILKGRVHILKRPSDDELRWLYEHCAFTIYPSLWEGWGLPISESLEFGKYCLANDIPPLREAGKGLAWHADTLDGHRWLEELLRLMTDSGYRQDKEEQIRNSPRLHQSYDFEGSIRGFLRGKPAMP